jgi:hypothetical protein
MAHVLNKQGARMRTTTGQSYFFAYGLTLLRSIFPRAENIAFLRRQTIGELSEPAVPG